MSQMLIANPIKGRRGKKRRSSSRRRRSSKTGWLKALLAARKNPSRRRRRSSTRRIVVRARRNPIIPKGFSHTHAMPAAIGAIGAILNDIAIGSLASRLPAQLQDPSLRYLIKAATAIGVGMAVDHLTPIKGATIRQGTVGALTCVLHDAGRAQVQKFLPTVPMGEYLSEVLGPLPPMPMLGEQLSDIDDVDDVEAVSSDVY